LRKKLVIGSGDLLFLVFQGHADHYRRWFGTGFPEGNERSRPVESYRTEDPEITIEVSNWWDEVGWNCQGKGGVGVGHREVGQVFGITVRRLIRS
jgi:hypothetical protein